MNYFMLNKPKGYITADSDRCRPVVMDLISSDDRKGTHPVGRLDMDTVGLLLITDDGKLSHRLMSPQSGITKTYRFFAFGVPHPDAAEILSSGSISAKGHCFLPATLNITGRGRVEDYVDCYSERKRRQYMKNSNGAVTEGTVTVTEGRKHEVKLLMKAVGCTVFFLERIAIGDLVLDDSLKRGEYRRLTDREVSILLNNAVSEKSD